MPIQTYEIQAPDGSTLEIQSDHQPTRIEAQAAIRAMQRDVPTSRARLARANATPLQEPTTFLGGAIKGWQSQAGPPVTLGDLRRDPSGAISRMRGNLATDLTDPQILGGALASYLVPKAVDAAGEGLQVLRENYSDPIKDALAQRLGFDPTAKDLAATRLRLQAARSQTRQAVWARKQAEAAVPPPAASATPSAKSPQPLVLTPEQMQLHAQQMANAALLAREQGMKSAAYGQAAWKTPPAAPPRVDVAAPATNRLSSMSPVTPEMEAMADRMAGGADRPTPGNGTYRATSPAGTSAESARPSAGAGSVPGSAAPPSSSLSPLEALQRAGLSPEEADQAVRWVRQGVELEQVVKRIDATRALLREKPALKHLPTLQQALAEVRNR